MTNGALRPPPRGGVWLVGAGPGDPELLTLKAVRAIAEADVILVDDLVDPAVLAHARPGVRIRRVGKRGGCRSTPQAFIDRLLVREARAGHRVVRLKGGDPLVFGRAGEEIDFLRRHGIEPVIVNGVTSALAAAADLGLSLTHRDCSQGVMLVTAHPRADRGDGGVDHATLARAGITLVYYMGVASAGDVQRGLLEGGLSPATRVAVVQSASRAGQRAAITTLAGLVATLEAEGLASPALIIVGDVVRGARALAGRVLPGSLESGAHANDRAPEPVADPACSRMTSPSSARAPQGSSAPGSRRSAARASR